MLVTAECSHIQDEEEFQMKNAMLVLIASLLLIPACSPQKREFSNPILSGFYPDPSICRVGSDYYLVNSSFSYFPGIPIFHSKDLVNWKQIGHVMDRPEQLNLDGLGVSRGIFAPTIEHHDGVFYVVCTLVDNGGNFVVTATAPEGPYSNPTWIPEIDGIDPSLYFDESGVTYIIYNSVAPENKPLYEGHRTIRMYQFDVPSLKVAGEEIILVNGGVDLSKNPIWIEAPHIFKKDGWYYLIAAEGGTADQHSEVVFRSKNVDGPYTPSEKNPILTQRHLDPQRKDPITTTGHADIVQTESGDWWAVFLGCRPYRLVTIREEYFNTGRETFLAPVRWVDGWPIINPDFEEIQYSYPYPLQLSRDESGIPFGGNFEFKDEFDTESLSPRWIFLRTPREKWYDLNAREGFLSMQVRPEACTDNVNPSFLAHRQQHLRSSASAALDFAPQAGNEKSGIAVFQNESHFYFLCKSIEGKQPVVQLYKSETKKTTVEGMELIASEKIPAGEQTLYLKIDSHGNVYSFHYAIEPNKWNLLKDSVDARFLSTKVAGGFVGCVYALYSTSLGQPSKSVSRFDWFKYRGDDETNRRADR